MVVHAAHHSAAGCVVVGERVDGTCDAIAQGTGSFGQSLEVDFSDEGFDFLLFGMSESGMVLCFVLGLRLACFVSRAS